MKKGHPLSHNYGRLVAAFAASAYALLTAVTMQTQEAQELAASLMGL